MAIVTAKKVATSGIFGKLRNARRVCEDGYRPVRTAIFEVTELDQEGIETKRKNATMSSRQKNLKAEEVEIRAARCSRDDQLSGIE